MKTHTFRGATLAAIAVPVLLITSVGIADAAQNATAIGGRAKIKVTVIADMNGAQCDILIDGTIRTQFPIGPNASRSQVYAVAPGPHMVGVNCPGGNTIFNTTVNVGPPNMLLDFFDSMVGNIGSSALSTDPASR